MIKKLRWKLTAITTVLLTAVLLLILIFVYQGTRTGLRSESMTSLRAAERELSGIHHRPGDSFRTTQSPCFILTRRPDGTFIALGSSLYDLSDQSELEALLDQATATELQNGILKDQQLRFLELESGPDVRYAFMDISAEMNTLSRLNLTCFMIFIAGLVIFFCISVLIAHWAVRPVDQAWNQQRQFIADASHELKTPLTVILTNAELLNDPGYDADSKARFSENILTMSQQMRGLVEDLLDQARIDNNTIERIPLDMSRLVEDAVLPFEPVYFESGRTLTSYIQPQLSVEGSYDHLRQVVEILLDNGCKYSLPQSTVQLHLSRQGRNCMLSVRSIGTPLSPQQCKDIFKRFYRIDSARTMNHSYGLGLPIAQGIIEKHHGKIWAECDGEITTFFVTIGSYN